MPRFAAIATIIPQVLSSTWVLAVVAAANLVVPAAAQMPVSIQAVQDPKERCAQDIAFFDRYGAGRTENSDGQRNHTRIGAEIDCQRGRYEKGIAAMEDLLRRKKFDVPFHPGLPVRKSRNVAAT